MNERDVFLAALERADPADRAAYLDAACGGDAGLRRRVDGLLRSAAAAGEFLAVPAPLQLAAAAGDTPGRPADPTAADAPLPFLDPSDRPGSLGRLGGYEVVGVLGRGGMGIVLRAVDARLRRAVAVKVLAPPLAASPAARERFAREARAAAGVVHENVVPVHAVEDAGPAPYLVMAVVDGPTLQARIDGGGRLPPAEVVRVGRAVAAGLAAAHARGLVHRDIKPSNILLPADGRPAVITDFGLARAADDHALTQSGVIAGTPPFMSPEQADGRPVDPRSDLFSLGSVLYAAAAGRPPFRAGTTMGVLRRVCEAAPTPLRQVNPAVPARLAAVVARLHARRPADRYQTAAEVAAALADLERVGLEVPEPVRGWRRSRRPVAILMAAVLAAGGIVWRVWPPAADAVIEPSPQVPPESPAGSAVAPPPRRLTPADWARRPSPLDAVVRDPARRPKDAPPELVAVLGEPPPYPLPPWQHTHWMAQTADGRVLAVPSGNDVHLFDAVTGARLRTLAGHTAAARRPAFSPDGSRLAAGSADGTVREWETETGRLLRSLTAEADVWAAAYGPGGGPLLTASSDGAVRVWAADGRPAAALAGHAKGVNHLAFRPDGRRLATASEDGTVRLWDPDGWREVGTLTADGRPLAAVAWSPDGARLAAGDDDRAVVWHVAAGKVLRTLDTPAKGLLAFTPDGRSLLTGRHDWKDGKPQSWARWDAATGAPRGSWQLPVGSGKEAFFHLSPDGRTVFAVQSESPDCRLRAYDADTGAARHPHPGAGIGLQAVAFSPDGRTLAAGGYDGRVRLWDLAGWRAGEPRPPCRLLDGHRTAVWSLAFSRDGGRLATAGYSEGVLLVWDVAAGRLLHDLAGYAGHKTQVAFSPDGATVAAGGDDGSVHLWDADTGRRRPPWLWGDRPIRAVAFSPDGRLLAAGDDRVVFVGDAATGRRIGTALSGDPTVALAFRPDGGGLAAVVQGPYPPQPRLRLWDVATLQDRGQWRGHTDMVIGLAYHPAGEWVATGSWDGTVRVSDVSGRGRGPRVFDFRSTGQVHGVAFTPQGRHLAAALNDGTVVVLRLPAE